MTKITVTKEFSWDMAHMLSGHEGLCKNLHGHTYKMHVEVTRKSGLILEEASPSKGMIIDFKNLKDIVKKRIVDKYDHSFVYWVNSTDKVEHAIAEVLRSEDRKVIAVNYRPTAEEMACDFYQIISKDLELIGIELESIKLWETPSSFAEIRRQR